MLRGEGSSSEVEDVRRDDVDEEGVRVVGRRPRWDVSPGDNGKGEGEGDC